MEKLNKILIAIVLVTLSSCSADWHFQQACKKEPMFCEAETIVEFDTLIVRDTSTIIKEYHTKEVDTIVLDTNGVKVVVYRVMDSVKLVLTQKPDTVRITANRVVKSKPVVIREREWIAVWVSVGMAFLAFLLGWILRSFR